MNVKYLEFHDGIKNHLREIAEYNLKILNEEDVAPKDVCLIQKKEMPTSLTA